MQTTERDLNAGRGGGGKGGKVQIDFGCRVPSILEKIKIMLINKKPTKLSRLLTKLTNLSSEWKVG